MKIRHKTNLENHPSNPALLLILDLTLALTVTTVASAQTYTVLKNFDGSDGGWPSAGMVVAGSTLYGTTWWGGDSTVFEYGLGVVFKMSTDGSGYTVLHEFGGPNGGDEPGASLVLAGGTLYGTAADGGSFHRGVVFKVNTDGSGYTVLRNFSGIDGMIPYGGLVLSGSTLYGTTEYGGSSDDGVVFKVNTDGSDYTVLKNFTGSDGWGPVAGLVLTGSTLYGTTTTGGSSLRGVVFKVNTDGSDYAVLKSFSGTDGMTPFAGLVLAGGTLYGTTEDGGSSFNYPTNFAYGVVFSVNTDGTGYAVLKSFSGNDGANPVTAALMLSGTTLYGTTAYGGSSSNGVVFRISTCGSGYAVLKNFNGSDGANPFAGLVPVGSKLFGTTFNGGAFSKGVVFSLTVPPFITRPPLNQTVEQGGAVVFQVEAESLEPELTYQWFFGGTNALAGATNALLKLTNVQPFQAGAYAVVVADSESAVTSAPAMLQVIPPVERRSVPWVKMTGTPGSWLNLDYASALIPAPDWTALASVYLTNASQFYFDLTAPLPPQRFYRVWQIGTPTVIPSLKPPGMVPAITLTGNIGENLRVDYINQLGPTDAWVTLDTVTLTNATQLYLDVSAIGQAPRLWRIVPVP